MGIEKLRKLAGAGDAGMLYVYRRRLNEEQAHASPKHGPYK